MLKISTSILNASNRIESIEKLNNTKTDYVHIDIMDGKFVPNKQFTTNEVNMLKKKTKKPFDVHIMALDPLKYIKYFNFKNIEIITIHLEINEDLNTIIDNIKQNNCKVGIAIKPKTDLNLIDKYLDRIDMVLIMSVEPGFGGQKFIENTVDRISSIRKKKPDVLIEVDGGINLETIPLIKEADIAVVGSYITNKDNYEEAINSLKN